jgi:hypothetical protein
VYYQSTILTEVQCSLELVDRPWKAATPHGRRAHFKASGQDPARCCLCCAGQADPLQHAPGARLQRLGLAAFPVERKTMCFQLWEDLSWRCLACERLEQGQGMGRTAGAKIRKGIRSVEKDVCAAVQRFCVSKLLNETTRRLCMALDSIGWHWVAGPWFTSTVASIPFSNLEWLCWSLLQCACCGLRGGVPHAPPRRGTPAVSYRHPPFPM